MQSQIDKYRVWVEKTDPELSPPMVIASDQWREAMTWALDQLEHAQKRAHSLELRVMLLEDQCAEAESRARRAVD